MAIVQDNTLDKIDKNILSSIISIIVHRKIISFLPYEKKKCIFHTESDTKVFWKYVVSGSRRPSPRFNGLDSAEGWGS